MAVDLIEHETTVDAEKIKLTAYSGGSTIGRCAQITVGKEWACMTFKEAVEFFAECINKIKELNAEYNANPPYWEKMQRANRKPLLL